MARTQLKHKDGTSSFGQRPIVAAAEATGSPQESVELLAINQLPIDDAHREKCLIERHGNSAYVEYLRRRTGQARIVISEPSLEERICEVYRICSDNGKDLNVVQEFVAFHPGLALTAPWLVELVRHEALAWRHSILTSQNRPNRLYRALAHGLRQAATPSTRINRFLKRGRLEAARIVRENFCRELHEFLMSADLPGLKAEGAADRIQSLISRQIGNVIKQNPGRLGALKEELCSLVRQGHAYKASVLIASKLFNVSPRALQRKPPY